MLPNLSPRGSYIKDVDTQYNFIHKLFEGVAQLTWTPIAIHFRRRVLPTFDSTSPIDGTNAPFHYEMNLMRKDASSLWTWWSLSARRLLSCHLILIKSRNIFKKCVYIIFGWLWAQTQLITCPAKVSMSFFCTFTQNTKWQTILLLRSKIVKLIVLQVCWQGCIIVFF